MATPQPTVEMMSRTTKEGRKLTYILTVMQQPERARACGAGAKSSADRRPVDPPPVVELHIIEEKGDQQEDITFSYEANFFLFATLEMARPIAPGRVQPPATSQTPVLTGMPVSGMAYLDRPAYAGYFIFPDLSVRHEGKYKLSFNLYEETKFDKDNDAESSNDEHKPKVQGGPNSVNSSFDWRMEVKSTMFTVFSAKKFPGLKESTTLSRTVAEQGCRVRIRRDVRMRRRGDGKSGGDYDDVQQDEYATRGRASEAGDDAFRQRSISGSPDGRPPYSQDRRISGEGYQFTPSPVAPSPSGPQNYLNFGASSGSQFQAPQPSFAPPPLPQAYTPVSNGYQPSALQYRQSLAPPLPPNNCAYDKYPQSSYPSTGRDLRDYESDYKRASASSYGPLHSGSYPPVDTSFPRTSAPPYQYRALSPSIPGGVSLAPLKMAPLERKYEPLSSPTGPLDSVKRIAPPILSPTEDRGHDRSDSYGPFSAGLPTAIDQMRNGKRTYDAVFSSASTNQSLYNGMRPQSPQHTVNGYTDDGDAITYEELNQMHYKRADGTELTRELPIAN